MSEPGSAAPQTPSPAENPAPSPARNWLAWLAPIVAVFGLISYFMVFSRWPIFRDFPWLNLLILGGSVVMAVLALRRARSTLGYVGSGASLALALGLTGLLCFYAFHLSYQLPDAGRVVEDGTRVPAVQLASWDGQSVDLAAAAANDKLILVFYRGHW